MKYKDLVRQFYLNNYFNYGMTILISVFVMIFNIMGTFLIKELTDIATTGSIKQLVIILGLGVLYVIFLVIILLIKRVYLNNFVCKAIRQYKDYCFIKIFDNDQNILDREITGKYISVLTNDINSIEMYYVRGNFMIITQIISFIGAVVAMAYLNIVFTVCVLTISLIPCFVTMVYGKSLSSREKETSDYNEKFIGIIKDLLSGILVIKSFKVEKEVIKIFSNQNFDTEEIKNNKRKAVDFIEMLSTIVSFVVEIITFGIGAYLAIQGIISTGTVIAFVQLLNFVLGPIRNMGLLISERNAAKILIKKMCETIKLEESPVVKLEKKAFNSEIKFENVIFKFNDILVFNKLSITFEKGKSYMIVGDSGSGKSTLINLLMGYYDNFEGNIYIDSIDINNISKNGLREVYSVVQQNTFIFDDSIKNNISMFRNVPNENFEEVIKKSGLSQFIEEKGIDYRCGENGAYLSGGEKQRISIARSLIREYQILIMDEATSALDSITAQMIENEISNLIGITRIAISHKLDEMILKRYDEIIVISRGVIVQKGNFNDLIQEDGIFNDLYKASNKFS